MIEEALLVRFKGRTGSSLGVAIVGGAALSGDVGGFQRLMEIAMNDLKRIGIGVVDADLLLCQRMLDDLVFDALEGQ